MTGLCLLFIIITEAAGLFKGNPLTVESCNKGVTIENECNTCVCSQDKIYECSSKHSNKCEDNPLTKSECQSNRIYVLNSTICICNGSGQWPHDQCKKTFQSLGTTEFLIECKPNSYVKYDCNVCRCGPDGNIKNARCTKNKCENSSINYFAKSRKSQQNHVYGNCDVKNWYSLAPCQFCLCVNENRLVCNTGNSYSHKLELGAYNLSVCGKDLIREAIDLIPDHQKALRYGFDNKVNESAIPNEATNVNHNEGSLKFDPVHHPNENYEYYTDSEENKPPANMIGREASSFTPDNKENPNRLREERKESEQEQTDNEMGFEIEAKIPVENNVKATKTSVPDSQYKPPASDILPDDNLDEVLKLNLPMVLDKIFQMALRKSMVSVDSESKCTPGAATILKCNVCFCMKENKLLCTNNVCQ